MTRRVLFFALLLLTLLIPAAASAQEPPSSINRVLNDLSAQVEKNVALADLDNWSFEGVRFPDTSLGCPQTGQVYSQVVVSGLRFTLTYEGDIYDYRISDDGNILVLCSVTEGEEDSIPCPPPGETGWLPPRLTVRTQGRVVANGFPNNVRQLPGSSSQLLGEIPAGATFNIVAGPECSTLDKLVWWQVDYNGLIGWTPEGQSQDYWLEPLNLISTPIPTPGPQLPPITRANAADVKEVIQATVGSIYALAQTGNAYAIGFADGTIIVYEIPTNREMARVTGGGEVTSITFGFDTQQRIGLFAAGGSDGSVRVWQVGTDKTLQSGIILEGQTAPITALKFMDNGLLAAGDESGSIYLYDIVAARAAGILTGHTEAIATLDVWGGNVLFSVDTAGDGRIWGIPPGNG